VCDRSAPTAWRASGRESRSDARRAFRRDAPRGGVATWRAEASQSCDRVLTGAQCATVARQLLGARQGEKAAAMRGEH